MYTTSRRIAASASTNQGPQKALTMVSLNSGLESEEEKEEKRSRSEGWWYRDAREGVESGFRFRVSNKEDAEEESFGFQFPGFGFRVRSSGFRVRKSGFRVSGFGFGVLGFEFQVSGDGLPRCTRGGRSATSP